MQTMTRPLGSRSRSDDGRLRITLRVLSMLDGIARAGLLTTDQIARRDGGSRQKVTRILQRLVELKLLRRADAAPEAFLTTFFDARPRCFAITQKGLRTLAAASMPVNVAPKKTNVLLAHEIETAECMFAVQAAIAAHGDVRLIDQPDLISFMPAATRSLPKPLRLTAEVHPRDFPHLETLVRKPIPISTEPDRLFAILQRDLTGWSFALELDRGTEDITARRLRGKATYFRKLLGYFNAWRQGKHLEQWGEACRSFRVLSVTTSDVRIKHMMDAQQEITRGAAAGLFLYSTREHLAERGVLGNAWLTSKGDAISLLGELT